MHFLNRIAAFGLSGMLLASTVAFSTTSNSTSFNTAALNKDAAAIAYAVQIIETMPGVINHLSTDDKARFDSLVAQIESVTASIEASSGGSITVDTGKSWAKSLGADLNTLLTIATPIVQTYCPSAASYMQTVQSMAPLVEMLAGLVATPYTDASTDNADLIRARIYRGI